MIPMKKSKKPVLVALSAVLAMAAIALLTLYLFVRSMIAKINIVDSAAPDLQEAFDVFMPYFDLDGYGNGLAYADNAAVYDELIRENYDTSSAAQVSDMPLAPYDEFADIEKSMQSNIANIGIKEDKNVFNILLIGNDTRQSGKRGRSDAMILVSVNKKAKTITATSILRDIYLKIPGRDKSNRINAAFAYGGANLLLDTIRQNFRIQVDKYVVIDFYAFIDMVDAVGGVTVEVSDEDIPIVNGYVKEINKLTGKEPDIDCLKEAGYLLLNGKQALGYCRNRYIGSDFSRTARQREVLEQIFNKAKKLKLSEIKELADRILPQITTNLQEKEIISLLLSVPAYIKYDIKQATVPVKGSYKNVNIRGMDVLVIDFVENIRFLHESLYIEKDG